MTDDHRQRRESSDELLDDGQGEHKQNQPNPQHGNQAAEQLNEAIQQKGGPKKTGSFGTPADQRGGGGQQAQQPTPNPFRGNEPNQQAPKQQSPERQAGAPPRGSADKPKSQSGDSSAQQKVRDDDAQQKMQEAKQQLEEYDNTPEEEYKKRLEQQDISLEEAERIVDTVILQNQRYREVVNVYKDIDATFQTRTMADQERVQQTVESLNPQYNQTMNMAIAKGNLATSLVRLGDQVFASYDQDAQAYYKSEKDINDTRQWIENINEKLFQLLNRKLREFDVKVQLAVSDGYADVF